MRNQSLIFIMSICLLASCSDMAQLDRPEDQRKDQSLGTEVSLENALKVADKYMNQISGGTRSIRKISSIEKIKNHKMTRSSNGEAIQNLFYLINYEGNGGFALLGADTRMEPVYAISGEGHLEMSDTIENKGLALMINSYMPGDDVIVTPAPTDTTLILDDFPVKEEETFIYYRPLLSSYVRLWSQGEPFNQFTPIVTDENDTPHHCLTGCLPLAVGMIMTYYSFPTYYNGYIFDWNAINEGWDGGDAAYLIAELGNSQNLAAQYGLSATPASTSNLKRTFNNYLYNFEANPKTLSAYKSSMVDANSSGSRPLLMINEKHAWIVDGHLYRFIPKSVGGTLEDEHKNYVHCVWGWGGSGDGYYLYSSTSLGGDRYRQDESDFNRWEYMPAKYSGIVFYNTYSPRK